MINELRAKDYCCEDISLIENYLIAVNDKIRLWVVHHRKETDLGLSKNQLRERREYYARPASELIFMTKSDHSILHRKGRKLSEETKEKLRKASLGNTNCLGRRVSEDQKQKQREKMLGRTSWNSGVPCSESTKDKLRKANIGKRWYNNGTSQKQFFPENVPEGWIIGRII